MKLNQGGNTSIRIAIDPNLGEVAINDLDINCSAGKLKQWLMEETGAPISSIRLITAGKELKDEEALKNHEAKEALIKMVIDYACVIPNNYTKGTELGRLVWKYLESLVTPPDEKEGKLLCQIVANSCVPEIVSPMPPRFTDVKKDVTEYIPIQRSDQPLATENVTGMLLAQTAHPEANQIIVKMAAIIQPILVAVKATGTPLTLEWVVAAVKNLMYFLNKYGSETPLQDILSIELVNIEKSISSLTDVERKCAALGDVYSTEIEELEKVIISMTASLSDQYIALVEKLEQHCQNCNFFEIPSLEKLQQRIMDQRTSNQVEIDKCKSEIGQLSNNNKTLEDEKRLREIFIRRNISLAQLKKSKYEDHAKEIQQMITVLIRQYRQCSLLAANEAQIIEAKQKELPILEDLYKNKTTVIQLETEQRQQKIDILTQGNMILSNVANLNSEICEDIKSWRLHQKDVLASIQQEHIIYANNCRYKLMDKLAQQEICSKGIAEDTQSRLREIEGKMKIASQRKRAKEVQELKEEQQKLQEDLNNALVAERSAELEIINSEEVFEKKILVLADKLAKGIVGPLPTSNGYKVPKQVVLGNQVLYNPSAELRARHLEKEIQDIEAEDKLMKARQMELAELAEKKIKELQTLKANLLTL